MLRYPITYVALGDSTAVGVGARNGAWKRSCARAARCAW
jgi:hypothetical protein